MSTEVEKVKPIEEVRGALSKMKDQFSAALPKQIDPEKFVRVVMTAVQNNQKLVTDATRQSLYSACMKCASDGLLPDGREAALVIFKGEVAYMPMVGGILKKVRNSGELSSITSQMVHKNDRFRFWIDVDGEHIDHEPLMFGDRGEAIGVYALAKTKDGAVYVEVLDKAQVLAIKNVSRAQDGPWKGAFEFEMWRKSAIRRLSKRLPMSTDLEAVIKRDDDFYDLDAPKAPAAEPSTKPKKLGKIIKDRVAEATVVEAVAEKPVQEKL